MVSVASVKSSSIQHDVHLVNYGPIYSKIDNKAGYALGRGYLVIDRTTVSSHVLFSRLFARNTKKLQGSASSKYIIYIN